MRPDVILALLSDLYHRLLVAQQENAAKDQRIADLERIVAAPSD